MPAPALAVDRVWKYFGEFPALRDITLDAAPGACLALLGRNGAGKTTLLRLLAGLATPTRGTLQLERHRAGYIGHGIGIYDDLSARENLMLFARLYDVPNARAAVSQWLTRTQLARVADSPAREFSRGMRQRLAIARAFLHNPDVLLLDEPFTSLDDRAIALLQELLRETLGRGATVVMSTHQLREAMELATHVALLVRGKLAFHGPRPPEMIGDPTWLYARHGEPA
ncbi:MAG: heme ABC exporter ATP-binding protein CcmA [Acidobacteria bacterium]|nr:heme ABC exporter ATP-binding protein CcmA [Acidobacteriota bacterium]